MNRAQCFISYCSVDSKPKEVKLIVEYLEDLARRKSYSIDFLFDKNLVVGNDLNRFMKRITTVDSVIIICSPEYKKRYENENNKYVDSGVYKEATLIKQRLDNLSELSIDLRNSDKDNMELFNNRDFAIFPLVLKSDGEGTSNSVPDFLSSIVREKINDIVHDASEKKESDINFFIDNYRDIFMDIIINTSIIHSKKSQWLDLNKKELLQRLVFNHKAEYAPPLDSALFVQTYYYDQIHSQESYFMIGRKGSGKTTVKQFFYSSHIDEYKGVIDLQINNIGMDNIFNYLIFAPYDGNVNLSKDIEEIFTYETVFRYIWILYIYLYSFYLVSCECKREQRYISESQKKDFKCIVTYINKLLKKVKASRRWDNNTDISGIIYSYAMERVINFCNLVIENSRDDEFFISDIRAQFNYANLLNAVLGERKLKSFYQGIADCDRRILLTVDGFDDAFDLFRQGSMSVDHETKRKREVFQVRWISELLELVHDMKGMRTDPLFKLIDVCILIPKDQFVEILSLNRDRYKYNSRFCEISWSGIELAIMVRKRLEKIEDATLTEYEKRGKRPEELLDKVLDKAFPDIPKQIVVKTKQGLTYRIPIFLYMLRYSFWRPRDILLELYLILMVLYNHNKTGLPINEETIKTAIKRASISTVASEFYSEFRTLWNDIKDNIEQFKNSKIVLTKEELKDIVMSSKFQIKLSASNEEIEDFQNKTRFLYEIGFLGILVDDTYRSKYQMVTKQGFVFSEGMNCIKGIDTDDFLNCFYLINPSFIETLNLDINTEEYIGVSNWNELRQLENGLQIRLKTGIFDSIGQYKYISAEKDR